MLPDEGEIRLEGRPVHFATPQAAREAGIETVYQNLVRSPTLSIADNMFPCRIITLAANARRLGSAMQASAKKAGRPKPAPENGNVKLSPISAPPPSRLIRARHLSGDLNAA